MNNLKKYSSILSDAKWNESYRLTVIWDKVFKNGPSKIYGKQPLKNLKRYGHLSRPYHFKIFKGCLPQITRGPLLNTLSHMVMKILITKQNYAILMCTIKFVKDSKKSSG